MKKKLIAIMMGAMMLMTACQSGEKAESADVETGAAEVSLNEETTEDAAAESSSEEESNDEEAKEKGTGVKDIPEIEEKAELAPGPYYLDEVFADDEYEPVHHCAGCSSFDEALNNTVYGWGHSVVDLDGTELLFIGQSYIDDDFDAEVAIETEVYYMNGDTVELAGNAFSGGTLFPLRVKDGIIYSRGYHYVRKCGFIDGKIQVIEEAMYREQDDKGAYYYATSQDGDYSGMTSDDAKECFNRIAAEYLTADVITFQTDY